MGLGPTKEFTVQQPHVRLGHPHVWSDDTSHLSLRWAVYEPLVSYDQQGRFCPGWLKAGRSRRMPGPGSSGCGTT